MRILLIESNEERRQQLTAALQLSGMVVHAVDNVAEIVRWPRGEVVVTDVRRCTPWWRKVGALAVVALAETTADGIQACERDGASAWLPSSCTPDILVSTIATFVVSPRPSRTMPREPDAPVGPL